jgi:hypothetical protein
MLLARGAGFGQGSKSERWITFVDYLLKWYLDIESGQAAPTREFFASEAPAPQPSPLKEQNRVVMLREGKITDAHRSGDKLSRRPLGEPL